MAFFTEIEKQFQDSLETKKTQNSQNDPEQ
jgi:hypothetical protein